jgi:hypothetical protein
LLSRVLHAAPAPSENLDVASAPSKTFDTAPAPTHDSKPQFFTGSKVNIMVGAIFHIDYFYHG